MLVNNQEEIQEETVMIEFVDSYTCESDVYDQICDYAKKLREHCEAHSGSTIPPRIVCFFTQRGFVKLIFSGSVLGDNEPIFELIPCLFESVDPENPEVTYQCFTPDQFSYDGVDTPEECLNKIDLWIKGVAQFICSIDAGYAESPHGAVTGYSSTFEQDILDYNQ